MFHRTQSIIYRLRPNFTRRLSTGTECSVGFFEKNIVMIQNFFQVWEPLIVNISALGGVFGGYYLTTNLYHKMRGGRKSSIQEYLGYTLFVSVNSAIGGLAGGCISSLAYQHPIFSVIFIPLTFATYYLRGKYSKLTN